MTYGSGVISIGSAGNASLTIPVTVPNGGTGTTTLTGLIKGNGAAAFTASKVALTEPANSATITIADGKTLTVSNTLTFTGTDGTSQAFQASDTIVGRATTDTLTNKRITARVQSVSDAATITPDADANDCVDITAIGQAFTIANPSGTPTNFQKMIIRIKDNATARAITWGNGYVAGGVALPSTTVLSKILTLGFIYNTANALNKWQLVASAQEA